MRTTITPLCVTDSSKSVFSDLLHNNDITSYDDVYLTFETALITKEEIIINYTLHNEMEKRLVYHPRYRLDYFYHDECYWLNADYIALSDEFIVGVGKTERLTQKLKNTENFEEISDKPIEDKEPKARFLIIRLIENPNKRYQYLQICLELWAY